MGITVVPVGELAAKALALAARAAPYEVGLGSDCRRRTGVRLESGRDFDAWLLRWPPGTNVTPHDHGVSAGAFTVLAGELTERRWTESGRQDRLVRQAETVTFGPGVVHDVLSLGVTSYSVHVYSPPLTEMSFYDEVGAEPSRQVAVGPADELGPWISELEVG